MRQLIFKLCIFFHPQWYFYSPKYDFVFHRVWPSKTQHNISFTGLTPEKQFLILKNWNITAVQLSRQNIFALLPEIFKNSEFWNYFNKISSFVWSILNISKLFPTINAFVISKLFFLWFFNIFQAENSNYITLAICLAPSHSTIIAWIPLFHIRKFLSQLNQ